MTKSIVIVKIINCFGVMHSFSLSERTALVSIKKRFKFKASGLSKTAFSPVYLFLLCLDKTLRDHSNKA